MSKIVYSINSYDEVIKESGEWPTTKLGALRESIRKWKWLGKELGKLDDEDVVPFADGETCALCEVYHMNDDDDDKDCIGCPVYKKTGFKECLETPYREYVRAQRMLHGISQAKKAALKEIAFLESLLPKKPSPKKPHL